MSSTSETGPAKLVTSFENLLTRCQQLGTAYNPAQTRIQITSLTTTLAGARAALQAVNNAKNNYNFATNARQIEFRKIPLLATRIVNALEATDAPQQTIDDARFLIMKLNGKRAKPKPRARIAAPISEPGEIPAVEIPTRSVSQMGYDAKLDHLAKLVLLITSEPAYATNETDLQVASLNTLLTNLQNLNTVAITAEAALGTARLQREEVFRGTLTGLTDVARQVKKYVRSVFGPSSPEFKQLSSIRIG